MTSINFRPDDSGLQSLKKENTSAPSSRELGAITPYGRTQAIQEDPPTPPQAQALPAYAGPERRKGERRKDQARVILDTRDKRERRRQAQDMPDADDIPKIGIDEFG